MKVRHAPYVETEASRLYGTVAYFLSEVVWEEESYYSGWDRDDPRTFLRGLPKRPKAAKSNCHPPEETIAIDETAGK